MSILAVVDTEVEWKLEKHGDENNTGIKRDTMGVPAAAVKSLGVGRVVVCAIQRFRQRRMLQRGSQLQSVVGT